MRRHQDIVERVERFGGGPDLQRVGGVNDTNGYYQFQYVAGNHETTAKDFSFSIYPNGSKTIPARAAAT